MIASGPFSSDVSLGFGGRGGLRFGLRGGFKKLGEILNLLERLFYHLLAGFLKAVEVMDALSERFAKVGSLSGSENHQNHGQNHKQFGYPKHVLSPLESIAATQDLPLGRTVMRFLSSPFTEPLSIRQLLTIIPQEWRSTPADLPAATATNPAEAILE